MRARLRTIQGHGQGNVLSLDGYSAVTIGRIPSNTIQVRERDVSRTHCRIVRFGAVWRLVDAGSRNGTLLNGEETRTAILKQRDKVQVGHTTFELDLLPGKPDPHDLEREPSVDETVQSSAMFPVDATTAPRVATEPTPVSVDGRSFSWLNPIVLFLLSFALTLAIGAAVMAHSRSGSSAGDNDGAGDELLQTLSTDIGQTGGQAAAEDQ